LTGADLSNADLTDTILDGTILYNTNMQGSIGITDERLATLLNVTPNKLPFTLTRKAIRLESHESIREALEPACDGKGISGTNVYDPNKSFHSLMIVGQDDISELSDVMNRWEPMALRFSELVVCAARQNVTVETCPYPGESAITRHQDRIDIQVVAAMTGEIVEEHHLLGSLPASCPEHPSPEQKRIDGEKLNMREVEDWLIQFVASQEEIENLFWQDAMSQKTISSYQGYINRYPSGRFISQAQEEIENLFWQDAVNQKTIGSYQGYINRYPSGRFVSQAQERVENLHWQAAKREDTIESYEDYVASYPSGRFIAQARERLQAAKEQGKRREYLDPTKGKFYGQCDARNHPVHLLRITNNQFRRVATTNTDAHGQWVFRNIEPGDYIIWGEKIPEDSIKYHEWQKENLIKTIKAGQSLEINTVHCPCKASGDWKSGCIDR